MDRQARSEPATSSPFARRDIGQRAGQQQVRSLVEAEVLQVERGAGHGTYSFAVIPPDGS